VILIGPNNARVRQMKNEKWKMTYGKYKPSQLPDSKESLYWSLVATSSEMVTMVNSTA
jgi:hypothetical protein